MDIENPLREWCLSKDIGYTSNSTKLLGPKHIKHLFFFTWERLVLEDIDTIQISLSSMGARALIFTNTKISVSRWPNLEVVFLPELYGAFYLGADNLEHRDERLFSCLMRRADTVRQSWFYELHSHELLDKGFVSYLSINPSWNDPEDHVSGFDHIHHQWDMGTLDRYQAAWQYLRGMLPYQNFSEEHDLDSCHDRCKYSIVLSTHNDYQGTYWFNEKEARALQSASIVLPSLHPKVIGFLDEIGLKLIFDQHAYMDLSWWQRQEKVLDLVKNDRLDVDLDVRNQTREHNRALFLEWSQHMSSGKLLQRMIDLVNQFGDRE
jgi:hypothetical protein